MARSARLDVTVDGSGAKAGASDVDRELNKLKGTAQSVDRQMDELTNTARKMGGAMKTAGTAASEMAAAAQKSAAATKALDSAVGKAGASAGLARHHVQNLAFQINDLGIQLASGSPPLMAFVQQGSQIGGIMGQAGIGVGGLVRALGGMVGGLVKVAGASLVANPLVAGLAVVIGTAVGAMKLFQSELNNKAPADEFIKTLGLTKDEIKELEGTTITFGDVLGGLWDVFDEGFGISDLFSSMKDWAVDAFTTILDYCRQAVVGIYASFNGLYEGLKGIWDNFPAVIGDAAISAANLAIKATETVINKAIDAINSVRPALNSFLAATGSSMQIGEVGKVNFGQLDNPYQGAGRRAADAFGKGFQTGMKDADAWLKRIGDKWGDAAIERRNKRLREQAEALKDDRPDAKDKKTKAAKDSTDELAKSLDELRAKYEPATAAAKEYAETLEKIDALQKAGRIDSLEAAKLKDAAWTQEVDRRLKDTIGDLSPMMQESFGTPMIDAADITAKALVQGAKTTTEILAEQGLDAAQQIAQVIGGSVGGTFSKIIAVLQGAQTGDFSGIGGKAGQFLNMMNQFISYTGPKSTLIGGDVVDKASADAIKDALSGTFEGGMEKVFDPLKKTIKDLGSKLGDMFGMGGSMSQMLGQASGGAAVGQAVSGIMKGLGIKTSQTGAQIGGAIGSFLPIPGGAIIGSIAGGLIGGMFKKTKKGSSTIGYDDYGNLGITSTVGNSNSRKQASIDAANSVISSLQNIADSLGGNIGGEFGVSIGMRNKKYVVDTTGQNRTKGAGVLKFTDQAEALKAAVQDAIRDGAIEGLREGTRNLLNGLGDIEAQLQKAVKFENVFRELKQRADPVGAAIDDLNKEFESLKKVFTEARASTEEWADLEKLYQMKRTEIIEQGNASALQSMKDYLNELKGGSSSPLSAQIKYANTLAALTQLDAKRASGKAVDFDDYQTAADNFLAASREFNGSNSTFFRDFERVTSTVQRLINAETNKVTTTAPTVDFTPVVNAVQEQTTVTTNLLDQIAKLLAGRNGAGTGTTTTAANDAASALAMARYYLNF